MLISNTIKLIASVIKYINLLVYNHETYAEWIILNSPSSTKDANGIHFVDSASGEILYLGTTLKPSTKYGLLYNVSASSMGSAILTVDPGESAFPDSTVFPKAVGNQKLIMTTLSTITKNRLRMKIGDGTGTQFINLNSLRLIELAASSQIESDFNTLTADQLNAKYPF